jgi:hypothetical protein
VGRGQLCALNSGSCSCVGLLLCLNTGGSGAAGVCRVQLVLQLVCLVGALMTEGPSLGVVQPVGEGGGRDVYNTDTWHASGWRASL